MGDLTVPVGIRVERDNVEAIGAGAARVGGVRVCSFCRRRRERRGEWKCGFCGGRGEVERAETRTGCRRKLDGINGFGRHVGLRNPGGNQEIGERRRMNATVLAGTGEREK